MKRSPFIVIIVVLVVLAIAGFVYSRYNESSCVAEQCMTEYAGTYVATKSQDARTMRLLTAGTMSLETAGTNGQEPTVEIGTWTVDSEGRIAVTLKGNMAELYPVDRNILFEKKGGNLIALEYDQTIYGTDGLNFKKTEDYDSTSNVTPVPNLPTEDDIATTTATSTRAVPFGKVTLSLGETAQFQGLALTPVSIAEDSRCAQGLQCIWAGTVRLNIRVASGMGTSNEIVSLGGAITTESETIALTAVEPYPVKETTISPGSYRFVFNVTKTSGAAAKPAPAAPAPIAAACYVGGCSSQICSDNPDIASTCEFREEYACYRTAKCERQSSGSCGWTPTAELNSCLKR
ncbi:MAG: hypothetical protein V4526_01030 [Patescibacteria group bacterium]